VVLLSHFLLIGKVNGGKLYQHSSERVHFVHYIKQAFLTQIFSELDYLIKNHYTIQTHFTGKSICIEYINQGFESWQGLGIFLFTTVSRLALGTTQPSIQWVPGALFLEVKWLGCEADHSPSSSAEVKEWVAVYLHPSSTP
jgi:hypothetical protein